MSAPATPVVLALTPRSEQALEPLLYASEAELEPVASVAAADELERTLLEHPEATLLLSPDLSGLEPADLQVARALGARLVGVALDPRERALLEQFGLDRIIEPPFSGDRLQPAATGFPLAATAVQQPSSLSTGSRSGAGSLVAVVGSRGAPGASECAASIATLLCRRWPTLLVEFDLLGGGLDVRLGADPENGSLLALLRALAAEAGAPRELLERWLVERPGWPQVLLAPPAACALGAELCHPSLVGSALAALSALYPLVVCDVGFLLDPCSDSGAARAHAEALRGADAVLLVLGAREQQLRHGLCQLALLRERVGLAPERLRLLLNGTGGPGAARTAAATLTGSLAELGFALDAELPWDQRALTRSLRRGRPLADAHRHGRYSRALERLLAQLFLPSRPQTPPRKQQLAPALSSPEAGQEEVPLPWRR